MSHTKGPWIVTTAWEKKKYNIRPAPHRDAIAVVLNKHIDNARLIAAAPEMLDCLERFVHAPSYELENVKLLAREMIAKARGES